MAIVGLKMGNNDIPTVSYVAFQEREYDIQAITKSLLYFREFFLSFLVTYVSVHLIMDCIPILSGTV